MFRLNFRQLFSQPASATPPSGNTVWRIPNIFHFCFGFQPDAKFGFLEYLAIKSAYELNRPERIYLHYQHECSGEWWQKARELVTLNRIEAPSEIYGRPLKHFAHRADVVRLRALLEQGGIYLDIDTLCVRPFTELRTQACVLGKQGRWYGLCNAVILSEPQGVFLSAWLDSFHTFRSVGHDAYWD
ncbi:MAG: glycosyltransferase, partial [Planctomycetota bacterium]|nr:glycosyltransferase [Planctomycetota bacterium]